MSEPGEGAADTIQVRRHAIVDAAPTPFRNNQHF